MVAEAWNYANEPCDYLRFRIAFASRLPYKPLVRATPWKNTPRAHFRLRSRIQGRLSSEGSFCCPEFGRKEPNVALSFDCRWIMRILFFSHYFPPEGNAPASRTYENCKRWVRDGHEVTVVTCVPNCPDGVVYEGYNNRIRPQHEVIDGIRVVRVWTYIAAHKGTVRRIMNFVSYMCSAILVSCFLCRPSIIIASSPQFFCAWAGLIAGKLRRVPRILEIRDLWPDTIVAIGAMKNSFLLRFLELLEKWMYRGATHIVTVGDGYKSKLLEKGVCENDISVITNGVDLDFFHSKPHGNNAKQLWGLEGKFVCAYVGTLGLCSGLEVVPRAARILKEKGRDDIVFLLVGDGNCAEVQFRFLGLLTIPMMAMIAFVLLFSICMFIAFRQQPADA